MSKQPTFSSWNRNVECTVEKSSLRSWTTARTISTNEATIESLRRHWGKPSKTSEARNEELDAKQEEYVELIQKSNNWMVNVKSLSNVVDLRNVAMRRKSRSNSCRASWVRRSGSQTTQFERIQVERKVELKNVEEDWSQLVEELGPIKVKVMRESIKELQNRYIEQLQENPHVYSTKRRIFEKSMESKPKHSRKNDRAFWFLDEEHRALEEKSKSFCWETEELHYRRSRFWKTTFTAWRQISKSEWGNMQLSF